MDKYTATEEAYKRGQEFAIRKISEELTHWMWCRHCPCDCEWATDQECQETLALWMMEVVNGEDR